METVLVGLDVRSGSTDPLRWASGYCRESGDDLLGVVAYRPTQSEFPPEWYDDEVAIVRKQAEADLDAISPPIPHRVEVVDGEPRDVILHVANAELPRLVVVGAHGSGGFRGLGVGSVAHHLAHHLVVPLVIVPALGGPVSGSPVVVGLDGSAGDVRTLDWAVRYAQTVGGTVEVLYASDPMAMSYPHPRGATIADQLEAVVRKQVARATATGIDIDVVVEVADPVDALARFARRVDASVVVVGRKGVGHLRGLVLGRVPAQLPFHIGRPVAIVPRPTSD